MNFIYDVWYRILHYFESRKRMRELKKRDPFIYEE